MSPDVSGPAGAQRFVQLPTDTERSSASVFEAASSAPVPLGLSAGPLDVARQGKLLGALAALLHRCTQQSNIALDVLVRDGAAERRLALDLEVEDDAPVSSVIERARLALAAAAEPANGAAAAADGRPSNVSATLILSPLAAEGAFDVSACAASAPAGSDVNFVVAQAPEKTLLGLSYNAKLIRPATVSRLIDSYLTLLGAASSDPTTAVERLPLLSPGELRALTVEQDSGTASYPTAPVHRLFEALAKRQPDALAAAYQDQRITYRELDERSSRLAHHLVACGVGPEVPVAVCVRPSLHVLVGMLATWKARGIYLPLDPTHPEALVGRMLDEARPRLVLTTADLAPLTARFPQLCLDAEADVAALAKQPATAPENEPALDDAAYLFYTSGTTGKSKGVVATQGNLSQYIHSAAQKYGFGPKDVFTSLARYTFSISLFELLSPLCCGGSLRLLDRDTVLTPERLCQVLEEITVLHAGPSLLGSVFRYLRGLPGEPRAFPGMRHASSGGDMVSPSVMEEMKRVFPSAELFVIYGCTEISCMGTTYPIRRDVTVRRTFVGKAFPDVTVRVLDPNRNLVPFGAVGEICFAGKGIVRGYLDRPELNAEKFVEIEGRRFYQTGDMGRLHPDGNVEILGRRDFQVQLRGIRIELAGIEKTVLELGLAVQCAVVAKTLDDGDMRLVAFVVKPADPRVSSFRRALAAELPDYMIPHHVVVLDAMPLTVNGKLDRNKLKELPFEAPAPASRERQPLASDRERKVAEVFARVLGLGPDDIGADDSFFDLGGHSLLGIVTLEELERALGVKIPPHVLFESGTARALASRAGESAPASLRPIRLNRQVPGLPIFLLSGIHRYRELARQLDGRCTAYGVFAPADVGAFDSTGGIHNVEDLAKDYVEIIRNQQPVGPYQLLGYSFAGIVAYEVAQQLRAAGDEVRFLALVDPILPEWILGWRFRVSQLTRLVSSSPRDTIPFILRRLKKGRLPPQDVFAEYEDDKLLGPLEARRDDINRNAAARYMPRIRPFSGNVTLIVSQDRLREDPLKSPTCGWGPYIPSLDIRHIDGDHFKMLSDDPLVSELAAFLVSGMARADALSRDTLS